ncbi:MAG: hypothetical protein AUH16_01015 [Acidobacteria bacterium 13_2_20CM_57_7]|nr:MAG: hypothetical protein AUH16_01015 [Acidobacteria bacterium 13_2_20CM_57_7]
MFYSEGHGVDGANDRFAQPIFAGHTFSLNEHRGGHAWPAPLYYAKKMQKLHGLPAPSGCGSLIEGAST